MRYDKQALIAACDQALERDLVSWRERRNKDLAEHAGAVRAWHVRYAEAWATAGLVVRKAIREGRPVTRDMLPMDRRQHSQVAVFFPQHNLDREYTPPAELTFLRRVLDVVADDEVTTSGLEKLGVSVRTMRDAAWHMAVGSAKE